MKENEVVPIVTELSGQGNVFPIPLAEDRKAEIAFFLSIGNAVRSDLYTT